MYIAGDQVAPTPIPCEGRSVLDLVFDVNAGRFTKGTGRGVVALGSATFRNGAAFIKRAVGFLDYRMLFTKAL